MQLCNPFKYKVQTTLLSIDLESTEKILRLPMNFDIFIPFSPLIPLWIIMFIFSPHKLEKVTKLVSSEQTSINFFHFKGFFFFWREIYHFKVEDSIKNVDLAANLTL